MSRNSLGLSCMDSAIRLIGFGDFGDNVILSLVNQDLEPEFCMTIGGNMAYLSSSPVPTRVQLERSDDWVEKYCYHKDDPDWGSRMIFRHREYIRNWCSGASLVIIMVAAQNDALFGAAETVAGLVRERERIVVTFVEKPLSSGDILYGAGALVGQSDTSLLFSLNRFYECLPPGNGFHAIYERSCAMVGSIISDIIKCTKCSGPDNISLSDLAANGIGYAGHGEAASVKEAMDLALASPTLEYGVLDRAGVVFAYFTIREAADMNDRDEFLAHLRQSFDRDIDLLTCVRIDPDQECRVTIIATNLV